MDRAANNVKTIIPSQIRLSHEKRYIPKYILSHSIECYFPNGDPMRIEPMTLPGSNGGGFGA